LLHKLTRVRYSAQELKELNKDHVLGALEVTVHIFNSYFGKAPASGHILVGYHEHPTQGVLLGDFSYKLNQAKRVRDGEEPFVADDFRPRGVDPPDNGHFFDQDLACSLFLHD